MTQVPISQQDVQLDPITLQVVRLLNDMGIMFPTPIDPKTIKQFPLDITQTGMLELGELHSYWTAMHARDTGIAGMITACKRSLKFQIAKIKPLMASKDESTSKPATLRYAQLEQQFARIDAMDAIIQGVADGHRRYAEACSRELSRRQIEATLSR